MNSKIKRCVDPVRKLCYYCKDNEVIYVEGASVIDLVCFYMLPTTKPTIEELTAFDEWFAKMYPQETEAK